jgi:hypothetical protein
MESLRVTCEKDLHDSIESEWGVPVELTSPDGETQRYSMNNPSDLLMGQVLNFTRREDPQTGETIVVKQPVVTLRISSLIRVPLDGERWIIKSRFSPLADAPLRSMLFSSDRASEDGSDIGFMRLYSIRIEDERAGPVPVS